MPSLPGSAKRWRMLLLALPFTASCAGIGWEDVLSGIPSGGDVRGEVEWVDQRSREIGISGGWGSGERVRYDSRTRVVYRNRNYRVSDLERGDVVSIDVDSDSRGRRYARIVRVERSVRDSGDRRGDYRRQRYDGRVAWIDYNRGQFGVEVGRSEHTVSVSSRSGRDTLRRFERLRRGTRVRFEGQRDDRGRIVLVRFL